MQQTQQNYKDFDFYFKLLKYFLAKEVLTENEQMMKFYAFETLRNVFLIDHRGSIFRNFNLRLVLNETLKTFT